MSKKLSYKDKAIIACAGSGKTTYIVDKALKLIDQKVLVITYTNENLDQIRAYFIDKNSCIPSNIVIKSWFSFLLQECARPYQNFKTQRKRIQSIYYFPNGKNGEEIRKKLRYIPENLDSHYLTDKNYLYEDKVSKFAYICNECSKNSIIKRLENIYNCILIDEAQDLEGWDYDFVGDLFKSKIYVCLVGDPRQKILKTHRSNKNRSYDNIFEWLENKMTNEYEIEEINKSIRCNQQICDFVDQLFPKLPQTISENTEITKHDGIFFIPSNQVGIYINTHKPAILRYSKKIDTLGFPAINIGISKGRNYDRILIFPTRPMLNYLKTKDRSKAGDRAKLYVAVTRARYSVAFVVDDE